MHSLYMCTRAGILQYLHSPSARAAVTDDVFTIPSKDIIRKFIRGLVTRLENRTNTASEGPDDVSSGPGDASNPDTGLSTDESQPSMTIEQQLQIVMRQSIASTTVNLPNQVKDGDKRLDAAIRAEMAVFESSGKRGCSLQNVYNYLLSIPPTSVEAERAFSAAGALCTKLRSRLSDRTLDTLCFLRAYFRDCR